MQTNFYLYFEEQLLIFICKKKIGKLGKQELAFDLAMKERKIVIEKQGWVTSEKREQSEYSSP